jgi:drug/metabolite transporter (DMT)-like permease
MNTKRVNSYNGFLEVLISGIGFGFLGIFGRYAFQSGIGVGELLTLRFTLAAVILWFIIILIKPKLCYLPPKQILVSAMLGIFGYSIFANLYFMAIKGVSVTIAAMLLFTFPVFVNLGAHFFLGEKLTRHDCLILGFVMLGLTLLLWGEMTIQKISSIFFGLGAALIYSIYILVSSKLQKDVKPISSSLYVISFSALTLWIFNYQSIAPISQYTHKQFFYIFGIAILCTIMPLTFFLSGIQKMKSSQASIIATIEPVTASLAAYIFLGEALKLHQMLGGVIVVTALIKTQLQKKFTRVAKIE